MLKVSNNSNRRCAILRTINIVRLLREELQVLQEQGSYVGEVVKAMDKKKVLVKVAINTFILCEAHMSLLDTS